jgi:NTE family protein
MASADTLDLLRRTGSLLARTFGAERRAPGDGRKSVNLALQGGGAHGAFTWGVLDRLLEDGRLRIEGISGASAGAVNAVLLAQGLAQGGADAARERLAGFWRAASHDGRLPDLQRQVMERLFSGLPFEGWPVRAWFDALGLSPYDVNPLNINPLKDLIERFVDFDAIRAGGDPALFVSATNVHTGELRVFSREEVSAEVVTASACLPHLFRAVEIDGEAYWDGGYLANPALFPFFHTTATEDLLLVQINPVQRREVPTSAREITGRLNEITFNASLMSELRAIEVVAHLIDQGRLPRGTGPGEYRRINLHRIALDSSGLEIGPKSKLKTGFDFFTELKEAGRAVASDFLDRHFEDIGVRGTMEATAAQ